MSTYRRMDGIIYLFSPVVNVASGLVVGLEVLPTLRHRGMGDVIAGVGRSVHRTALDVGVAAGGIDRAAELRSALPLRVNLLADTVADDSDVLEQLHDAVRAAGRRASDVTVELGPPIGSHDPAAVIDGAQRVRAHGYKLAVDEVGLHDHPLAMIAAIAPDQVKLHPEVVSGLDTDPSCQVIADTVGRVCRRVGAEPIACGITLAAELDAVRAHGIMLCQGPLLAAPTRRPLARVAVPSPTRRHEPEPERTGLRTPSGIDGGSSSVVGRFAQSAVTLPESATGGEVRETFRDAHLLRAVVLVDSDGRPVATLDRNRFMLAVSGQYGFALHDRRPALGIADPPRMVPDETDLYRAVNMIQSGPAARAYDDIVVTDQAGRCVGLAGVGDLLRGLADQAYDQARALDPATGLPGAQSLDETVQQRIRNGRGFDIGALTPDLRPATERGGFALATDTIRHLV